MKKNKAEKVIVGTERYLKYGFVITEHQTASCPRCRRLLNAGTGYQPRYCSNCGQKLSFAGILWMPERTVGYADLGGVG